MDPHVQLMSQIEAQYMMKNMMYANASHVTYSRFGSVSYALRLTDKMARYENLTMYPKLDHGDEAVEDTLRDAINYICMWMGDLNIDSSDPSNTENVKSTLGCIHVLAKRSWERIKQDAENFEGSHIWKLADGQLRNIPYVLFIDDPSLIEFQNFASYLITKYIELKGEDET